MDGERTATIRRKMLGTRLRAFRERFHASIEECAGAAGLSQDDWRQLEVGKQVLSVDAFLRLCSRFRLTPEEVYDIEGTSEAGDLSEQQLRLRRKVIGAALAQERSQLDWDMAKAAEQTGFEEVDLLNLETGCADMSLIMVEQAASAYGLELLSLLGVRQRPAADWEPVLRCREAALDEGIGATFAPDIEEFLRRPEAERLIRAAMALAQLNDESVAAIEEAVMFLRGHI